MEAQEIISSGLLELYVAGLTSKEETAQVEQWIKQYPEVSAELVQIQLGVEEYAFANAVKPDDSVKQKILSQINADEGAKIVAIKGESKLYKVAGSVAYWKWAAAASILLLLASLALNVMFYGKYDTASKDLQQSQEELADAMQSNSSMKQDMNIVQSKYSEPVSLHGMKVAPDAAAKIFWMKNTGEVYVDPSNLPDIAQGKQFQLWAIVDGKPVDAGMILTSKKGDKYRIQKMKTFGTAQAFAITIEKEGGSPTPTMDQMVVSNL